MFSPGQIAFALLFILAFTAVMIWVYRKDRKWHKQQYKGALWVLVFFIGFVIMLLALKYFLKK